MTLLGPTVPSGFVTKIILYNLKIIWNRSSSVVGSKEWHKHRMWGGRCQLRVALSTQRICNPSAYWWLVAICEYY